VVGVLVLVGLFIVIVCDVLFVWIIDFVIVRGKVMFFSGKEVDYYVDLRCVIFDGEVLFLVG